MAIPPRYRSGDRLSLLECPQVVGVEAGTGAQHISDSRPGSRRHGRARETENEAGLYSSHYLDASLSLTWLLDVDAGEDPAIDVVYINRSRVDAFGGAFGRLARSVASSRQRDGMLRELKALRDRLESEFSSRH
jgi:hypothetical protein